MTLDRTKFKYCPGCGEWLPNSFFHCNKARADGLHSRCADCRSQKGKEARRKNKLPAGPHRPFPILSAMADEIFAKYWADTELHVFIQEEARHWVRNIQKRKEAVQEAWLYISLAKPGQNTDALKKVATSAIRRYARKDYARRMYGLEGLDLMSTEEYLVWMTGVCR